MLVRSIQNETIFYFFWENNDIALLHFHKKKPSRDNFGTYMYFPFLAVFKTFWVQTDGKIIFAGGFSEQSDMQKYIFQEMV